MKIGLYRNFVGALPEDIKTELKGLDTLNHRIKLGEFILERGKLISETNTKVFSSDGYNYCYSHPQALFSIGDELIGLETESTALVTSMLNNAENYSAI